jgi:putative hydrolase of the HAD superfamily
VSVNPTIEAVTFDVDGTLYSIRRMVIRHFLTMLPVADFFKDLHKVRDEMRGQGPFDDFRQEQAQRLAQRRNLSQEQAFNQVIAVVDERWMRVFKKVRLFRGVRSVLAELGRRNIKLGLISDYPLKEKIKGMRLEDIVFDASVVSEQTGALKPHPASFILAAKQLELKPEKILHVGDREDCDIEGAKAAGMLAALFVQGKKAPQTKADFVFTAWKQFIPILEERRLILSS